ncbi:MAG: hypothetical protein M3069_14690 [Chloroflexota bacterium]|nr:hypothetical protein [Chloroflexota bacterium]
MPEVGLGLPLERFTLVARGEIYCVVDIVDQDVASVVLTPLPDAPLDVRADKARHLVSAWRLRAEVEPSSYEVREEQRAL